MRGLLHCGRGRSVWLIGVAVIGVMIAARDTAAAPGDAFQQASDGLVSIEAEHPDANVANGGQSFVASSPAGASGSGALTALPNSEVVRNTGYAASSPRLEYRVNFVKTGTHYIWARGIGNTPADDSFHAGLDGAELASSDRITGFGAGWTWSRDTMDGPVATVSVTTTGVHVVTVWMREDGFTIDKLVITTDPSFAPTGLGPAESARQAPTAPPPPRRREPSSRAAMPTASSRWRPSTSRRTPPRADRAGSRPRAALRSRPCPTTGSIGTLTTRPAARVSISR